MTTGRHFDNQGKTILAIVDKDTYAMLRTDAYNSRLSMSEIIRRAIEAYYHIDRNGLNTGNPHASRGVISNREQLGATE